MTGTVLSRALYLTTPLLFTLAAGPCEAARRPAAEVTEALRREVRTIVVIYAENRSFDGVFGWYPDAHGLAEVVTRDGRPTSGFIPQRDRDGSILAQLPPTWGGVTAPGSTPVVTQADSVGLANAPFPIETAFAARTGVELSTATVTRDLYHRFFENQMQIGGGGNDGFAAWSDAGGLTMGHFDNQNSRLFALAREFTLADRFFAGAFGGSFINHQYLICACAPTYPDADATATGAKPTIAALQTDARGNLTSRLVTSPKSPASAMDGPPVFTLSGNLAPRDYFGDHEYHAVNTMQPPFQPSGVPPQDLLEHHDLYAAPAANTTLPPQTQLQIGDQLTKSGISWAWYAGAWREAIADGRRDPHEARRVIYAPTTPRAGPNFQPHHAPFNYYASFDPMIHAAERTAHLRDYQDLLVDAASGHLPSIVFYKPQGNLNQHEGYTNLDDGDAHIAGLIATLQRSPQWRHMVIIVTYDEYGGVWDHLAPPAGDLLGPGTRVPTLVISPFARRHFVDHTPYDTGSILRLIARRHRLPLLPGLVERDRALQAHGEAEMGDLTHALVFRRDP